MPLYQCKFEYNKSIVVATFLHNDVLSPFVTRVAAVNGRQLLSHQSVSETTIPIAPLAWPTDAALAPHNKNKVSQSHLYAHVEETANASLFLEFLFKGRRSKRRHLKDAPQGCKPRANDAVAQNGCAGVLAIMALLRHGSAARCQVRDRRHMVCSWLRERDQ